MTVAALRRRGHLVGVDEVVELAAARLEDNDLGDDEHGEERAEDGPHHVHEPRSVQDDEQGQVTRVPVNY